jgi:hypothetical protein
MTIDLIDTKAHAVFERAERWIMHGFFFASDSSA